MEERGRGRPGYVLPGGVGNTRGKLLGVGGTMFLDALQACVVASWWTCVPVGLGRPLRSCPFLVLRRLPLSGSHATREEGIFVPAHVLGSHRLLSLRAFVHLWLLLWPGVRGVPRGSASPRSFPSVEMTAVGKEGERDRAEGGPAASVPRPLLSEPGGSTGQPANPLCVPQQPLSTEGWSPFTEVDRARWGRK